MKSSQPGPSYRKEIVNAELMPIVRRLGQLIKKQFNCEFTYLPLTDKSLPKLDLIEEALGQGQPIRFGGTIYFPVFLRSTLVGAADINDKGALKPSEINQLHKVIQTVLESGLASLDRLEVLAQLEEQLNVVSGANNVIELNHYRQLMTGFIGSQKSKPPVDSRFNVPVFISGQDVRDIHKMALAIHDHSHRFAFVKVNDLDPEVSRDIKKFCELGPATVFVPELANLDEWQQECLVEFFSQFRGSEHHPLIMAGSINTYSELMDCPEVDARLLRALSVAYLKLDRSFSEINHKEYVRFFFEALTNNRTIDS